MFHVSVSFSNSGDGRDGRTLPWDPWYIAALSDVQLTVHSWLLPFPSLTFQSSRLCDSPESPYVWPCCSIFCHASACSPSCTTRSTRRPGSHSTGFTSLGGPRHSARPWEWPLQGFRITLFLLWTWCWLCSSRAWYSQRLSDGVDLD